MEPCGTLQVIFSKVVHLLVNVTYYLQLWRLLLNEHIFLFTPY